MESLAERLRAERIWGIPMIVDNRAVADLWALCTTLVAACPARIIWATGLLMDIVSRQEIP
jgi:hypothetical protein